MPIFAGLFTRIAASRIGLWMAIAGAAVVGILAARWRSQGRAEVLDDQREDFIDRSAQGRAAARDADKTSPGMTGQERLDDVRSNDGKWE